MPTVIKLYADLESTYRLNRYLRLNELPQKERFHSTVFYANETPVFESIMPLNIRDFLPLSIHPPMRAVFFGKNLVLSYNSEEVEELNDKITQGAIKQMIAFPDLNSDELEILRQHRRTETEFIFPYGLRISNQRSGLVKYAKFNPHISIAGACEGHQLKRFQDFDEGIIFNDYGWETNLPKSI
jgi:hypothetical protein